MVTNVHVNYARLRINKALRNFENLITIRSTFVALFPGPKISICFFFLIYSLHEKYLFLLSNIFLK